MASSASAGGFRERRLLIVAFEGWNDAGEAATTAAATLRDDLDVTTVVTIDDEDYFDYQFNRPIVSRTADGSPELSWPAAVFSAPSPGRRRRGEARAPVEERLLFLIGTEPARRWRTFVAEVVETAKALGVEGVVSLGAMLADVPHTRPISIAVSSDNDDARHELDLTRSTYEGPTGIIGVLGEEFEAAGIPTISVWASVPHYVHNPPSPKATLAILQRLERLLGIPVPQSELAEEAAAWERSIDAIARDDDEMSSYIEQLEQARDTVDSPEASGEAIAEEFERYLRRRDDDGRRGGGA